MKNEKTHRTGEAAQDKRAETRRMPRLLQGFMLLLLIGGSAASVSAQAPEWLTRFNLKLEYSYNPSKVDYPDGFLENHPNRSLRASLGVRLGQHWEVAYKMGFTKANVWSMQIGVPRDPRDVEGFLRVADDLYYKMDNDMMLVWGLNLRYHFFRVNNKGSFFNFVPQFGRVTQPNERFDPYVHVMYGWTTGNPDIVGGVGLVYYPVHYVGVYGEVDFGEFAVNELQRQMNNGTDPYPFQFHVGLSFRL